MSAATEPTTITELQLTTTAEWITIREAAIDGLRLRIAQELEGIAVDKASGNVAGVLEREARVAHLRACHERANAWRPIANEIPRKPR